MNTRGWTASMNKPYYRWAWSPTTGDVTLSFNDEGRHHRYLHVLADERTEKDLQVGYAARMADGWKVMDDHWVEIDDPACQSDVEQAITEYENDDTED